MPRIKADIDLMITAYRAKIARCKKRAETLILSPSQFTQFLDLVEPEIHSLREENQSMRELLRVFNQKNERVFRVTQENE